ncbi:glycoside hydrolase family 15 protein [Euzebya rosea]|uniref:glycoside hydrolase family 15 protein n=1 Tax=Euzebya rosea TaxID=2052804 RepID=UPI00130076FB|nr:glycoside hydrolase family 15 protein [Euzebya rosea]
MRTTTPALRRLVEDGLVEASLRVIADGQAPSGAFVASPTFATYDYSWFRDGAFIADAMSRHGRHDEAEAFHRWCAGIVADRRDRIAELVARARQGDKPAPEDHLRTRYTLDGREADGFWENFQLDGYGTWLWALHEHHRRTDRPLAVSLDVIDSLVEYLSTFWDEPSYDWWEEHIEHRHVSTMVCIWAGLDAVSGWDEVPVDVRRRAAAAAGDIRQRVEADGIVDGALVKWLGSDAVDASLVACIVPLGFLDVDDPVARRTIERVEDELAPAGVHRYLDDVYYGGGQWILLAAFLGWYHVRAGRPERVDELLTWIAGTADGDGHLPEQVAEDLLHPDHLAGWEAKWGPSANPLLWSHAMLLSVVADLLETPTR